MCSEILYYDNNQRQHHIHIFDAEYSAAVIAGFCFVLLLLLITLYSLFFIHFQRATQAAKANSVEAIYMGIVM